MFRHIVRHGATAAAAGGISALLIAGIALAGSAPVAGAPVQQSPQERPACFAITDPDEIEARIIELQVDLDARLDAAVAAGVLTEETAAEIGERVAKLLERCFDEARDPDPDPKERGRSHGLGGIFRLVAGSEIGSFFRACFDPSLSDRQARLDAAIAALTQAVDDAVAEGDITAERGAELKAILAERIERCGDPDRHRHGDRDRHGDRHHVERHSDESTASPTSRPSPTVMPSPAVRSFEDFFRRSGRDERTGSRSFGSFSDRHSRDRR